MDIISKISLIAIILTTFIGGINTIINIYQINKKYLLDFLKYDKHNFHIHTDPDTKLQYISFGSFGGCTPRLDNEGKQMRLDTNLNNKRDSFIFKN